ncbi:ABC transporter permease [Vibrio sp. MA40-2]|uniref:ABC transporter permease n=1 Tax=Vibrio sp. MA40-2 TaxID=3391828 RepID=UPI0039A4A69C
MKIFSSRTPTFTGRVVPTFKGLINPTFKELLKQALRGLLLLALVTLFCFILLDASPIDPISYFNGGNRFSITPEQSHRLLNEFGLNDTVFERLMTWGSNVAQGQLGFSYSMQQPVIEVLRTRLPLTLNLLFIAWVGTLVFGYVLGTVSALWEKSWPDKAITFYAWVTSAIPSFWLAIVILFLFAVELNVAPVCCAAPLGVSPQELNWLERLPYLALPVSSLILAGMSQIIMHTREKVLDAINSDHYLYAKLHGESQWRLFRFHIFKNSLGPALIIHFASISELIGGSVLIESVFNYPGLGRTLVTAGLSGDASLLIILAILSATLIYIGNITANILNQHLLPEGANNAK